jgi:hypothetical protein
VSSDPDRRTAIVDGIVRRCDFLPAIALQSVRLERQQAYWYHAGVARLIDWLVVSGDAATDWLWVLMV